MPSEEFDKKLRDAADLHHPAYDEKAWEKMEKLLDLHMPVKEKRRRRIIPWLFLFLLAGGGLLVWKMAGPGKAGVSGETGNGTPPAVTAGISGEQGPPLTEGSDPATGSLAEIRPDSPQKKTAVSVTAPVNAGEKPVTKAEKISQPPVRQGPALVSGFSSNKTPGNRTRRKAGDPDLSSGLSLQNGETGTVNNNPVTLSDPSSQPVSVMNTDSLPSQDKTTPAPSPESGEAGDSRLFQSVITGLADLSTESVPCLVPEESGQKKSRHKNTLFVSVSAGPDISFVQASDPGRLRLQAGIGVGYTFRDRFTVRTGYYQARKIYSAPPDAYKPPAVFWNYYPYLDGVEGDCRIAEIPVLFTWHFGRTNRPWMITGGISSYLMKKEEYYYTYKNSATGPTLYRNWENHNRRNALFSVLSLSGGYRLTLNNRFQLLAEPYWRIPLGGVGYGNVRLNSGGLLFTLTGRLGSR